ncbi:MAG: hypothetical protein JW957_07300 [Candidatus Omnitrophica bacterium]|nr:hypothetical protein [Candidatus Omnitrophota bacterium]
MTPKESITTAMRNGRPDAVPVTLGLSEMVPVRYFGGDYIRFFLKDRVPLWKARVETEHDRFKADCFLHLVENPSRYDPPSEIRILNETPDEVSYKEIISTKKGSMEATYHIGRKTPVVCKEHFVKNPALDKDKVLELLKNPDSKDLTEIISAYKEIGDRAHAGFWISTPIDWWSSLRNLQDAIMDMYDLKEVIKPLFQAYTEYASALVDNVLKNTPVDSIGLGGSSTSMSVISPDFHREYSLEFGRAICETAHKYGKPVQYHMCGKSRKMLPITAEMGVDGFDALEAPPTGDVDLAEVKKTFGGKISLRGNVNSITVMMNGSPRDVEKDVIRCMESAKEGGGFILGVGDQTPYNTPEENLYAFVEAGRKYGRYD